MSTILWMDGFDHYTDLSLKYNTQYGNKDAFVSYLSAPVITAAAARNGAAGLLLSNGACIYKSLPDSPTLGVGFAFRFTINPPAAGRRMLSLWDETALNFYLYLTSARKIGIINKLGASLGTSSATFSANTWYFVEVSTTVNASGSFALKIDNTADITASGVVTNGTTSNRANYIQLGSPSTGAYPFHYDDLYISDGALFGPSYVDTPANSGTYPKTSLSASVGAVILTDYADILGGGAVHAIAVHTLANKVHGNTRAIRNTVVPSGAGTQYKGADHYLTVQPLYHSDVFTTNPNTAGTWTPPTFSSSQIGYERLK